MAKAKRKSNYYDITIIGSGLSNLIIAERFRRRGLKVALITEDHVLGDRYRYFVEGDTFFPQCLNFFPTSESSIDAQLEEFTNLWLEKIESSTSSRGQVTFDSGRIQEFLGFGENKPQTIDAIDPYLRHKEFIDFNMNPSQWIHRLENCDLGDVFFRQVVTKFEIEDKRIVGFTLNGAKKYTTAAVVYGGSLRDMKRLLDADTVGARTLTKLSKTPTWVGVHLFLKHSKQITEATDLHILRGSKTEPCLGQFSVTQSARGEDQYFSQWMTFISAEMAEDNELTGQALREIKKQIKRAYPEAIDAIEFERIYVEQVLSMDPSGATTDGQLKAVENLWLTGPGFHPEGFLVGDILWADHQWLKIIDELQPSDSHMSLETEAQA